MGVLGQEEIQRLLPHRPPFLLVDRVLELSPERILALKNVSVDEPYFQGHFPGRPIMPGVLILEAMAQAGAILALAGHDADAGRKLYLMAIDRARFRRPVVPGDQLLLEVVPLRQGERIWKLRGEARVGDEVVCSAEILATLATTREA